MIHKQRRVLFIMSHSHTGSTILNLLLGSHSKMTSISELNQLVHAHKLAKFRSLIKFNQQQPNVCVMCEGTCDYWSQFNLHQMANALEYRNPSPRTQLARNLFRNWYRPYTRLIDALDPNVSTLIDASKRLEWVQYQMGGAEFQKDIDAYVLYLKRDGRAVVNSWLRRKEQDLRVLSEQWRDSAIAMNNFYNQLPKERRFAIHYETLATDTVATLKSICDWLDISYESSMLAYWETDFHPIGGNAGAYNFIWKEKDIQAERAKSVERMNGDYYEQLKSPIELDMRWLDEFSPEREQIFHEIAGEVNAPFRYEVYEK